MRVLVHLDLSKYSQDTLNVLYKDGILTREEFMGEIMNRGCDEYLALQLCRFLSG